MANQFPKVSIGMPVYNMEDTLQEAIDTVLNQTFSDFQLIISDNASDDGTEEICRAAARQDSRVIYHRNSENILAENFRLLVLLSKGKYFMWAGARHSRRPEMVARCVEALEEDPKAVVAYTHAELTDPATGARSFYCDTYLLDQDDPAERYISLIQNLNLGHPIYGLYRRSVLYDIPPLSRVSPHFILFTDAIFLADVVLQGKVIQIPETLFYRQRDKSKEWIVNVANSERSSFPNYLTNGVTLPVSESIQEHVRHLLVSDLSVETKLRLTQVTYEAYAKRFGNALSFEINRAVQLAKAGRFAETWNGMPTLHPDKRVQDRIDQFYAGLLFDRLERTSRFIQNHQGLHLGKAFCLAKMGRRREAELELALFKELAPQKATQKQETKSKVSSKT